MKDTAGESISQAERCTTTKEPGNEESEEETVAEPVPFDCAAGDGLYLTVTRSFKKVRNSKNEILCIPFAEAARTILPVYNKIFGNTSISSILQKDLENSSTRVQEAAKKLTRDNEELTIEQLIEREIKEFGLQFIRKDSNNGTKNLLWMKRALDFVVSFLENFGIKMEDESVKTCAQDAYSSVLSPYHGFIVSRVVSLAFNFCPTRENLGKILGFEDEPSIKRRIEGISKICRPVLDETSECLGRHECNFSDKV